MKILKAILLVGFLSVIIIFIIIFIFAKLYLTPKAIEKSLRFEIKKQLRREVSFNTIETKLLSGIYLKGVTIHKSLPWEEKDVFMCEEVHIKHSYIPLILKKMLIRRITIERPRVNIQFLHGQPLSLYGTTDPASGSKTPLDIIFLSGSIYAQDGKIVFNDLAKDLIFPLNNVQVSADGISIISASEFTISASLEENTTPALYCQGEYSLLKKEIQADLTLRKTHLEKFKNLLNAYNIPIQKGLLTVQSKLKAEFPKSMTLNGTLAMEKAYFTIKTSTLSDEHIGLDDINATLSFQSLFDMPKRRFTIEKIKGEILSSPYEGKGVIREKDSKTHLTLNIHSKKFSLKDLFDKLQYNSSSSIKGLALSGNVYLKTALAGNLDASLFPTFIIKLQNNRILYPPLGNLQPELQGELRVDSKNIFLQQLKISTKNLSIALAGEISDYRQWPPESNLQILSSRINFYDFLTASGSEPENEIGPFNLTDLSFNGPIKLGNTSFFGIRLTNVHGNYLFANNKFLIKDLKGNIEQGSFNLSSTVDLGVKGLDYHMHLRISGVPLKSVMSMFPTYNSRFIDGTVSGTCALKGNGTQPISFIENLKGDAFLNIVNGNIKGLTLMPQISSFIKRDQLEKIIFNKAQLQLKLLSGIVDLDGVLISPQIEMYPFGQLGLDSTLNLESNLNISPDLFTGGTQIARYLPQEDGWITLPITIQGTLQDPRVSLSEEAINFILKETLPRLLMDMLSEKEESPIEEILENLTDEPEAEEKVGEEEATEMEKEVGSESEAENEVEGLSR